MLNRILIPGFLFGGIYASQYVCLCVRVCKPWNAILLDSTSRDLYIGYIKMPT